MAHNVVRQSEELRSCTVPGANVLGVTIVVVHAGSYNLVVEAVGGDEHFAGFAHGEAAGGRPGDIIRKAILLYILCKIYRCPAGDKDPQASDGGKAEIEHIIEKETDLEGFDAIRFAEMLKRDFFILEFRVRAVKTFALGKKESSLILFTRYDRGERHLFISNEMRVAQKIRAHRIDLVEGTTAIALLHTIVKNTIPIKYVSLYRL